MPEEMRNIATQHILSSEVYPDVIIIGEAPKHFLVNWFQ